MLQALPIKYTLDFVRPAGTSRGVMHTKNTYFIKVWDDNRPEVFGIGEAALFEGLSADDNPDYEKILVSVCQNINDVSGALERYQNWPSIVFGLETALRDYMHGGKRLIFDSNFTKPKGEIPINGLIWMGKPEFMNQQIQEKLKSGFSCLKMKIGAIDFDTEIEILKNIRKRYSSLDLELRVDANGAFAPDQALPKLEVLAKLKIHSIEQPIKAKQWDKMSVLCRQTPLPIALDEELIGVNAPFEKKRLLDTIIPQYVILKPSLHGGFSGANEWIKMAAERNIGWWATSALESNIGLNAIAQWVSLYKTTMPQGLGTGQVFSNNFQSPLYVEKGKLHYNPETAWTIPTFEA